MLCITGASQSLQVVLPTAEVTEFPAASNAVTLYSTELPANLPEPEMGAVQSPESEGPDMGLSVPP